MSHGLRSAIGKPLGPIAVPPLDGDRLLACSGVKSAIGQKPGP
jgi:hypothetical protein